MKKPIILSRDQKRLPVQVSKELSKYRVSLRQAKSKWLEHDSQYALRDPLSDALHVSDFKE